MRVIRSDVFWAAVMGATALAVYVRTLAPGLVAVLDTPMFQFIGRVLGVPHNPGYPLFVLLTHAVSRVPLGSLAYRVNLFSAVMGATAVALTFLIARRLGSRAGVAAGAALGLAFGQVFWSQATIAEVYTLHCALLAGVVLALLVWRDTRRQSFFFAAVVIFAAGLGNHTTIVAFAPGIALYALLVDRRFVLRWRTLALTAAILATGLLQYAFILVRSRQPGAYLESRAASLGELLDVVLARQFQDRLFAFDWHAVGRDRLPWLVENVLVPELTVPGLVVATGGLLWLLRRRTAEGLLLLSGCVMILAFASNYNVVDTPVFVIPAFLVLWITAGVGAEALAQLAGRWRPAVAVCVLAALTLPAVNVVGRFAKNDRSRDTAAAVHFAALFDALPDRALLVREDFLVDRLVKFKLLGEDAAEGRQIALASRRAEALRDRFEDGFTVLAFPKSARRLRYEALNVAFEPMRLTDGHLSELLLSLPEGAIAAVAVPAAHAERFVTTAGTAFGSIGGPDVLRSGGANVVIAGVRRSGWRRRMQRDGAGAMVRIDRADVALNVAHNQRIGENGPRAPRAFEVRSERGEAVIRQGSRDVVRSKEGVAVAVWDPDGGSRRSFVLEARRGFRVSLAAGPLSVYPLHGAWPRQDVRARDWTDVSASVQTGSVMARVPSGETLIVYVGDDGPLAPRVFDASSNRLRMIALPLDAPDGRTARLSTDVVVDAALANSRYLYRLELSASGSTPVSALVALGGVPQKAIARLAGGGAADSTGVFRIETQGLLRSPDASTEQLLMARDEQAQLTGHGWSPVDWDAASAYRWMTVPEARLVLPIAGPSARRLRIQALVEGDLQPESMRLRLNETELPALRLRPGWNTYEWSVPDDVFRRGTNEVVIIVHRLPRRSGSKGTPRGIAVSDVRVIHADP